MPVSFGEPSFGSLWHERKAVMTWINRLAYFCYALHSYYRLDICALSVVCRPGVTVGPNRYGDDPKNRIPYGCGHLSYSDAVRG